MMSCFAAGKEAYAAEQAWKLVLDHAGFGRCQAYLTETKVCFNDGILKRLIVSPFDESFVYNMDSKRYLRVSNEQFRAGAAPAYYKARIKKTGKDKILNMNCDVFSVEFEPNKPVAKYWTTHDVKLDPRLAALLSSMCAAPEGYGVPMRLMVMERSGRFEKRMNVVKLEKTQAPADAFIPPRGYAKATDLWDLHFCGEGTDYGQSVDDAFMIRKDAAKKNTK